MRNLLDITIQFAFAFAFAFGFILFFWVYDFDQTSIIKSLVAGLLFTISLNVTNYIKEKRSSN